MLTNSCVCFSFKNVVFEISHNPSENGTFDVRTRFLGVEMEKFHLKYQV